MMTVFMVVKNKRSQLFKSGRRKASVFCKSLRTVAGGTLALLMEKWLYHGHHQKIEHNYILVCQPLLI